MKDLKPVHLVALALLVALAWSSPVLAFEEEHQADPDACMGPTDPFCPRPPGSGSGDGDWQEVAACFICETDAWDPLDQANSVYYRCKTVDPLVQNGYTGCIDFGDDTYCQFSSSFCQVA